MNTKINLQPEKLTGKYNCQLVKETFGNQSKSIEAVITVIDDRHYTEGIASWVIDLENPIKDDDQPFNLKTSTTFVVKQGDDVVAGFFNLTEALFYYNNLF